MSKNQAIQKLLHKSGLCIRKYSPVALSFVASAGVVVTAIAAAKATPRAVALVYADSRKKHDGDPYAYTKKEAFIAAWKCYIPAVAFGASTIACIMGANALNRRQQAALTSAYALVQSSYKEYKDTQKGYVGNIQLLHRTTDPQTVYVKSKLDRDDIIDIQDFDVVQYLYGIDRMNLNEELATAIMIGDGREVGADGKIAEDKIRPIWLDDELYTIHADVDIAGMKATLQGTNTSANFGENYIYAEAVIQSLLYAREKYKGSGTPDFYCTPHLVNVMLLARDLNGRRIYDKVSDLAAALNVGQIITAEQFEGKTRTTTDSKTKKLLGLMVNLADYSLGATKGGEITHFTDFDIDFNQEKSLLETRCSGANTRVMSAIALEEDVTANIGG